jgi:hypothetical protein
VTNPLNTALIASLHTPPHSLNSLLRVPLDFAVDEADPHIRQVPVDALRLLFREHNDTAVGRYEVVDARWVQVEGFLELECH